jgi:multicomponent Na+:H+ antiporter subunit G
MTGIREIVVWALLGLAALVVVLSSVGLLAGRDTVPRLHFATPVSSLAAPLTGAAYVVDQGWGLGAALVILVVVLLAVIGPPLASAIGRASAEDEGLMPAEEPT